MSPLDLPPIETGWGDDDAPPPVLGAEWLRTPPGATQELIVLSPAPVRYWGHWHQNTRRYHRCMAPARCADCFAAQGRKVRFVLAVLDGAGVQHAWEFGEYQRDMVRQLLADGSPLRGLAVVLRRLDARGNPPVMVLPGEPPPSCDSLPEPVDVEGMLFGTWVRQALKQGKERLRVLSQPAGTQRPNEQKPNGQKADDAPRPVVDPPASDSRPVSPTAPAMPEPSASLTADRSAPEGRLPRNARSLLREPDAHDRRHYERFGSWPPGVRPQAPEVPPDDSS